MVFHPMEQHREDKVSVVAHFDRAMDERFVQIEDEGKIEPTGIDGRQIDGWGQMRDVRIRWKGLDELPRIEFVIDVHLRDAQRGIGVTGQIVVLATIFVVVAHLAGGAGRRGVTVVREREIGRAHV